MSDIWKWFFGGMIVLAIASGLMALVTMPAKAQVSPPPCGPAAEIFKFLAERFNEAPAMVLNGSTSQTVLTVSATGTWTLVVLRQDGTACLMQEGDSIRRAPSAPAGRDS